MLSVERGTHRAKTKWGEACHWQSTHGGINVIWSKSSFFQKSSQFSENMPRLKDCSVLIKMPERNRQRWDILAKIRVIGPVMITNGVDNAQLMKYQPIS